MAVIVIEVIRKQITPVDVSGKTAGIEVVKPGGTVVNVGVGPELPTRGYEGQVWIKI